MASRSSHSIVTAMKAGHSAVAANQAWYFSGLCISRSMNYVRTSPGRIQGRQLKNKSGSSRIDTRPLNHSLYGPSAVVLQGPPTHHHHHHQCCIHTAASTHSHTTSPLLFPSRATRAKLMSSEGARDFADSLNSHQRGHLQAALDEIVEERKGLRTDGDVEEGSGVREDRGNVEVAPPTWIQLRLLCYQQALPFLGFGFLDNFVMITVGEYIDLTIGATLTISTMAAAGLGNLISDLAGLGLADRVEALCRMIGIPNPRLSSAQLHYRSSRWMGLLGRCLGITVGCLLGMIPLLWFDHKHKKEEEEQPSHNN